MFLFVLLVTCYLLLVTKPAHAQCTATPVNAQEAINAFNRCAIETDIFDDKIFNFNQIAGTTDSLNTLLLGTSGLHPETNALTHGTGALAATGRLVSALYTIPPASGVTYMASTIGDFNPLRPAFAQQGGVGYETSLAPAQEIWKIFRNLAYAGFVIVFVIIGFMIMFRAHISPQAVATVQDSVPRIIVALILVTFSYAIAGLMVDAMYLLINLFISIIPLNTAGTDNIFNESFLKIITSSWKDIVANAAKGLNNLIGESLNSVLPNVVGTVLGWFGATIGSLIVGIAVLFVMFRVFLMLLMAYITIIILTVVSPLFFLLQALPGQNGARAWFQQMASNVGVFVAVALMMLFAAYFGGITHLGATPVFGSPLQGNIKQFPLLAGGFNSSAISSIIAIGLILMTPSAAEMVKNALGAKGGGPSFGAAGAALGAAAGVAYTGTGARSVVGGVQGAGRVLSSYGHESIAAKVPYFGRGVKGRKEAYDRGGRPPDNPPTGQGG